MPRARSSGLLPKLSNAEPKIMDIISMADHKMNCLSQEVTKLQGELLLQTDTVETLEKQVQTSINICACTSFMVVSLIWDMGMLKRTKHFY